MAPSPYAPPQFEKSAFHCPFCHAYANQSWFNVVGTSKTLPLPAPEFRFAVCAHCEGKTMWFKGKIVYPEVSTAPSPNPDLPDEIKADFEEARSIISRSPRGAAALFRLSIQKLCKHLGQNGKDLNADIAALVKRGLPPMIQQSLDIVRVIGNEAVHPGSIDLRDEPGTARQLAGLINLIASAMITQPKAVEALYGTLPERKRQEIQRRDSPHSPAN